MGINKSKTEIHYNCINDCNQTGCPGHVLRMESSRTSDIITIFSDDTPLLFTDSNELSAIIDCYKNGFN